jgi:MFS family permease
MLILVASFGYFVDIFDLILYNIVKKESLIEGLGLSPEQYVENEVFLFQMQMLGMMVGGILWGVLGDKKGRVSVLFGSILLYSLANLLNAFVVNIEQYAWMRFLAGVGLAGELGAAITLVSETMHKDKRGYGTMIVVTLGALGAVAAFQIGSRLGWKGAYITGGVLGLALLALRAGTFESGMFHEMKQQGTSRGNFLMLFTNRSRLIKYLACIVIGLPVWYVVGILISLSERFAPVLNIQGSISNGESIMYCYLGLSAGDLFSGLLSQWFRSRRKIIIGYLLTCFLLCLVFLFTKNLSAPMFYGLSFLLGAGTGYWALFVTNASEQFGTNLRATVTSTVPNFVRGAFYLIGLGFTSLSESLFSGNIIYGALLIGVICFLLAIAGVLVVKETFGKELDYVEVS